MIQTEDSSSLDWVETHWISLCLSKPKEKPRTTPQAKPGSSKGVWESFLKWLKRMSIENRSFTQRSRQSVYRGRKWASTTRRLTSPSEFLAKCSCRRMFMGTTFLRANFYRFRRSISISVLINLLNPCWGTQLAAARKTPNLVIVKSQWLNSTTGKPALWI